jgi:DNA-directed RNA polymerase subunit L
MQWTDGNPNDFKVAKFNEKPSQTEQAKTFILGNEDHTLGNALRHVVMQE